MQSESPTRLANAVCWVWRLGLVVVGLFMVASCSYGQESLDPQREKQDTQQAVQIEELERLVNEAAELMRSGAFNEALEQTEKALELASDKLDARITADAQVLRAKILAKQQRWQSAADAQQAAVELYSKLDVLADWELLDAQWALQDLQAAARRAPKDQERILQAIALQTDALTKARAGELPTALSQLTESLAIRRELLGENHHATAFVQLLLAEILSAAGQFSQAVDAYESSLKMWQQCLPDLRHPYVRANLSGLGWTRKETGNYLAAVTAYRQCIDVSKKMGIEDATTAVAYHWAGSLHGRLAQHTQAVEYLEEAVRLRRAVLGEEHLETGWSQYALGMASKRQGQAESGNEHLDAAVSIAQKMLEKQPDSIQAHSLANSALQERGEFESALKHQTFLLEYNRQALGEEDPSTAFAYHTLGYLLSSLGREEEAIEAYRTAVDIRQKVLGDHPGTADSLMDLGASLCDVGRFKEAIGNLDASREIQNEIYGEQHPKLAQCLYNLGYAHRSLQRFAEARAYLLAALKIQQEHLHDFHPQLALTLHELGVISRGPEALRFLERALEIRIQSLGEEHHHTACTLQALSTVYAEQGDFDRARETFERAWKIWQPELTAKDPLNYVRTIQSRAHFHFSIGDETRALEFLTQAAQLYRETIGPAHPESIDAQASLAATLMDLGETEVGLQILEECVQMPAFEPSGVVFHNLAGAYLRSGRFVQALEFYTKAIERKRRVGSARGLSIAKSHWGRARVHSATGHATEAVADCEQALELLANESDREDIRAGIYADLGLNRIAMGNVQQGITDASLGLAKHLEYTEELLLSLSDAEAVAHLESLFVARDALVSAALAADRYDTDALYQSVWATSGLVGRYASATLRLGHRDPGLEQLLAELQATRKEISQALNRFDREESAEKRRTELAALNRNKEVLQRQVRGILADKGLLAAGSDFREALRDLPQDSALIDFSKCNVSRFDQNQVWQSTYHYQAFVITRCAESNAICTKHIVLGPCREIDAAIREYRQAIVGQPASQTSLGEFGALVRKLVWEPLVEAVQGAENCVIVPAGHLVALPWPALPGEQPQTYLIEEKAFSTLNYAAQLPAVLRERSGHGGDEMLLVGAVEFGGHSRPPTPLTSLDPSAVSAASSLALRADGSVAWQPLEGTGKEVRQIAELASDTSVQLLVGKAATESTVSRQLPSHQIVHLATHGYFADPVVPTIFQRHVNDMAMVEGDYGKFAGSISQRNPLVLSGIVLASPESEHAEHQGRTPVAEDGILTGEEVASLDLSATELVVLSACESSLGTVARGEGVFGLQRAFHLGGAGSVIGSLWKVDDAATQALMTEFYRNLLEHGLGKREALRRAQLSMLYGYDQERQSLERGTIVSLPNARVVKEADAKPTSPQLPPRYWSAFVLSGDWR